MAGELEAGLVLEDDGAAANSAALNPQPVLAVRIVARRDLQNKRIKKIMDIEYTWIL